MPTARPIRRALLLALAGALALVAGVVGVPQAANAAPPRVDLALSKHTTTAGSRVTATVKIRLASGRTIGKASLSWGDGTARTKITKPSATVKHTYATPGTFRVVTTVTDSRGKTSKDATSAVVTAPSGSYAGYYLTGGSQGAVSFYVAADHAEVQDVSANVAMTCAPGGLSYAFPFVVDHLPLAKDGTFGLTVQRTGVFNGSAATFKQTFRGHVGGLDSLGAVKASGSLTSTVSYNNGTAYTCTSGSDSWSVVRDQQPTPQPTARPASGSYTGYFYRSGSQGAVSYYVSADRTRIQDLSLNAPYQCAPGGSSGGVQMLIDSLPVAADGSFSGTSVYEGVYKGWPATFRLVAHGHFHGTNAQGVARAAGSLVATLTYDNGTSYSCTSSVVPFAVTRAQQPTPQPTAVTAGDYSGYYFGAGTQGALSYTVSPDRSEITEVAANVAVGCSPGGLQAAVNVVIDAIPLSQDGSFDGTATSSGTLFGKPAQFAYTFRGHAHGTASTGHPRFAGSLRVDATYDDGTPHQCTSDVLPWNAATP